MRSVAHPRSTLECLRAFMDGDIWLSTRRLHRIREDNMVRISLRLLAVAVCLVGVSCSDHLAAKDPASEPKAIDGLWSGAWGGGDRNGVVFQPVMAELFIKGDHVELVDFPGLSRLTGTVRFDASARQMRITPTGEAGGQPTKAIVYAYQIKADELTLIGSDKLSISLRKRHAAHNPLANVGVELVAATGINDAGDLLVTEFSVLRAGQAGAVYFEPHNRALNTKQATVLLVQETGLKKLTVDEARGLIRESTVVVVAYRQDDRPSPHQFYRLWKEMGSPRPDSEAVWQTFSRILRPGTLVFALSARDNVPVP
jgi:hypothetical protein